MNRTDALDQHDSQNRMRSACARTPVRHPCARRPCCCCARYDLDLSTKPYKALRYHTYALRGAAFHPTYPLFASASDDGSAHVFHGRVFADLATNPLIVPVKILRGHAVVDSYGVLDCAFHPTQPWLFTAGGDGQVLLFSN